MLPSLCHYKGHKLYEGIDNSIIYHYSTHNKILRCAFSIFDIVAYINSKGIINRYIPFLIFGRLFNKLYELILRKIETDIEYSFNYYNVIEFSVPDYVIVSRDDFYEIYEIE